MSSIVRITAYPYSKKINGMKVEEKRILCDFGPNFIWMEDIECVYLTSRFQRDVVDHYPWVGTLATNLISDIFRSSQGVFSITAQSMRTERHSLELVFRDRGISLDLAGRKTKRIIAKHLRNAKFFYIASSTDLQSFTKN